MSLKEEFTSPTPPHHSEYTLTMLNENETNSLTSNMWENKNIFIAKDGKGWLGNLRNGWFSCYISGQTEILMVYRHDIEIRWF